MANSRRWAGVTYALVGGVLLAPTMTFLLLLATTSDRVESLVPAVEAIYTLPTSSTVDEAEPVFIVPTYGPATELRSPGLSGIVTKVMIEPGDSVENWTVILAVDGIQRVALRTAEPFYRPLSYRSRGADVLQLEQVLVQAGLLEGEPDTLFDRATRNAVKEFESALGVDLPQGVFDPEYVIWLPRPIVIVDEVRQSVFDTAPTQGEVIAATERPLESLQLTDVNGDAIAELEPGVFELSVGRTVLGVISDPQELAPTIQKAFQAIDRTAPSPAASASQDTTAIRAEMRRVTPLSVVTVPTSAVATDQTGTRFCVWVLRGTIHEPVDVNPVGGSLGATHLTTVLPDNAELLVNPLDILEDPSCP